MSGEAGAMSREAARMSGEATCVSGEVTCVSGEAWSMSRVRGWLDSLPDDATVEDATDRLHFLAKIEKGLAELDAGRSLDHEEVKSRITP
jgi:hypothetical protein